MVQMDRVSSKFASTTFFLGSPSFYSELLTNYRVLPILAELVGLDLLEPLQTAG
jgi:hypothetical protein